MIAGGILAGLTVLAIAGWAYGRLSHRLFYLGNPNRTYVRFYPNPGINIGRISNPLFYWSKRSGLYYRHRPEMRATMARIERDHKHGSEGTAE